MKRYTWRLGVLEAVMLIFVLVFAVPLVMLVSIAIRPRSDLSGAFSWPADWTFDNFSNAWSQGELASAGLNSLIVTVISVTLLVGFSAFAAYPLATVTARWSKIAFYFFMAGLVVPFQLGLIPLYAEVRDLGLLGSPFALVLFYTGLQMPFSVFLYTQFIREMPPEYAEAAQLDGASTFRTFSAVIFPLLLPITGTIVILNVILIWNDFFVPLLFLSGTSHQTIPVALYSFVGQYGSDWNLIFAGLIIGILPILVLYFLMQKSVFRSFSGGLKG